MPPFTPPSDRLASSDAKFTPACSRPLLSFPSIHRSLDQAVLIRLGLHYSLKQDVLIRCIFHKNLGLAASTIHCHCSHHPAPVGLIRCQNHLSLPKAFTIRSQTSLDPPQAVIIRTRLHSSLVRLLLLFLSNLTVQSCNKINHLETSYECTQCEMINKEH